MAIRTQRFLMCAYGRQGMGVHNAPLLIDQYRAIARCFSNRFLSSVTGETLLRLDVSLLEALQFSCLFGSDPVFGVARLQRLHVHVTHPAISVMHKGQAGNAQRIIDFGSGFSSSDASF